MASQGNFSETGQRKDPSDQQDNYQKINSLMSRFTAKPAPFVGHLPIATGTFSNFAFEVQMTITRGDCGGMVFRHDNNGHFYKFVICQDGSYWVVKYVSSSGSDAKILTSGSSSVFHKGLSQQNKIALVTESSTMILYVNEQQINQIQNTGYTSGSVGLIAEPGNNATDVAYTNARLWTL